jgi:RIO kinase 1
MGKITKEKFKTFGNVFDNFTLKNIISLAKKGLIAEGSLSPIKIGKEANIFSAVDNQGKPICLKIYRLETANFNQMYRYIASDPRFAGLTNHKRKIIFAWVQREYRNLVLAERGNVRVPSPIKFQFNVLIMELIGSPAPMLKDLGPKHPARFFEALLENMKALYMKGLAHGDLSKFNILNHKEHPVLIDLSHSTPNTNPIFKELLQRDCKVVAEDFKEYGINTTKENILEYIKG